MSLRALFSAPGCTVVGVLHLGHLLGQPEFPGMEPLLRATLADAKALTEGGVDALLLENFKNESPGPCVGRRELTCLAALTQALASVSTLPLGVNVLPNDYTAAFALARVAGLAFVQLDVLVDRVRTDYSYSSAPPFEVSVDLADLQRYRAELQLETLPLLATVHPKHYTLLEEKSLAQSTREALSAGADVVVVTGERTGSAPSAARVREVKAAADGAPLVLGSGLSPENAAELVPHLDGAIVGTAFRGPNLGPVVPEQVRELVGLIRRYSG